METTTPPPSHCACPSPRPASSGHSPRSELLSRALRLEYLTVAWNLVEGVVAVSAALLAGSVAILGFGIDSFVEGASAFVMIWRLRAERDLGGASERLEAVENRARRLIAGALFLLAAYVSFDAGETLWSGEEPAFSAVGVGLMTLSLVVMLWLARAKGRLAKEIGSQALEIDALQTTACWWLSAAGLAGVGLNGLLGWWWADPGAALIIAALIAREAREAWRGERCC